MAEIIAGDLPEAALYLALLAFFEETSWDEMRSAFSRSPAA